MIMMMHGYVIPSKTKLDEFKKTGAEIGGSYKRIK